MIFKTFKKLTRVPCPVYILLAIVQDRESVMRMYKTVRDSVRPYKTVYTTAHEVHSTSELSRVNIVFKSYGMELEQKSVGPYVNHVNVQLIEQKLCLILKGRNRPYSVLQLGCFTRPLHPALHVWRPVPFYNTLP